MGLILEKPFVFDELFHKVRTLDDFIAPLPRRTHWRFDVEDAGNALHTFVGQKALDHSDAAEATIDLVLMTSSVS